MSVWGYVLVALLGYALGGIPTAYWAGCLRGVDIRRHGSGNVGATNAARVLGWKVGLGVLAVDTGKGALAAGALPLLFPGGDPVSLGVAAGAGAILGHVFTPYLGFRGGKGVATGAGVLLVLAPLPTLVAMGVFLVLALSTAIVSVGSMGAALALPLATYGLAWTGVPAHPAVLGLTVAAACFVLFTHRANLRRLVQGKEPRFRRPWLRKG